MSLLPLYGAARWDLEADPAGFVGTADERYTDALFNAGDVLDAWNFGSGGTLAYLIGTDPMADFVEDAERLGIQHLTVSPGVPDMPTDIGENGELQWHVGDLGNRNTQMRKDWWTYLRSMQGLLERGKRLGPDVWGTAYSQVQGFPGLGLLAPGATYRDRFLEGGRTAAWGQEKYGHATPDLFVFDDSDDNSVRAWWVPYTIVVRMVNLHNKLFGSSLSALTDVRNILRITRRSAQGLIRNVARGLYLLETEITRLEDEAEDAELAALAAEAAMVGTDQEGFVLDMLSDLEMESLSSNPAYQRYFSTTFNKDIIAFIPIIQNFFLTGKYFQNVNEAFYNSNALALEILVSTIRNNDNYKKGPDLRRVPPPLAGTAAEQLENQTGAARDFILKMLIMTPINILKSLCELIDPHIGITKMIKRITGKAFDELAEVLNGPAEQINIPRREAIRQSIPGAAGDEAADEFQGINGDDLLKFILCLLQISMTGVADAQAQNTDGTIPAPPPNFFPDIERDGIDFTGKVSGLLMVPPTPLGLIYLLLGLINTGEGETVDVLEETIEPACPPPTPEDPSATAETGVNQCKPEEVS